MLVDDENKKIKSSLAQLIGALIIGLRECSVVFPVVGGKLFFTFFLEAQDVEENGKSVKNVARQEVVDGYKRMLNFVCITFGIIISK
jgi:hypothetical protein